MVWLDRGEQFGSRLDTMGLAFVQLAHCMHQLLRQRSAKRHHRPGEVLAVRLP